MILSTTLTVVVIWLLWTLRQRTYLLHAMRARTIAIENAAHAEKTQLSHELHDEIGQKLIALKLETELARVSGRERDVSSTVALLNGVIEDVRALSHSLRPAPFDEGQLIPALAALARTEAGRSGLCVLIDAPDDGMVLAPDVELTCYRIAREALHNVVKHARARHVAVSIACEGRELAVRVCDDGRGFDVMPVARKAVRNGRLGIVGMQDRAGSVGGSIDIESRPGAGTRLTCRVPLAEAA